MDKKEGIKVEENLKLVYSLVHKILHPKFSEIYSAEELIQIGTLGLMSASKRFDAEKGVKFSSYASKFIIGYVYNYVHDDRFVYHRRSKLNRKYQRINLVYLDTPINLGDEKEVNLLDTLEDSNNQYINIENEQLIESALKTLTNRERDVIKYIFIDEYTEMQVAKIIGVSQPSISRLHHKAINKLRNYINREEVVM